MTKTPATPAKPKNQIDKSIRQLDQKNREVQSDAVASDVKNQSNLSHAGEDHTDSTTMSE